MKEHEKCFKSMKHDSTYASHLLKTGQIANRSYEILHVEKKSQTLKSLQTQKINKFNKQNILLNDQTELNNSFLLNMFQYYKLHILAKKTPSTVYTDI